MSRIARSFIQLCATMLAISFVIFALLSLIPGDPAQIMLGTSARPDTVAALRVQLGLDRPFVIRYFDWIGGVFTGNLGQSYTYGSPVLDLIKNRLEVTLPLSGLAIFISILIAIPLGVRGAARPGGMVDGTGGVFAQAGIALPNFWIGLLLIIGFSLKLNWFPSGGFPGLQAGIWPCVKALILPAVALAIPQAAVLTRVIRASVLEVVSEDFVRTARAKGASENYALWRHVVPNALIPFVIMLGMQVSFLIGGAVLVENVFTLPGLGSLAYQALAQRDLVVIQNVVLFLAAIVIFVNFLVDATYVLLDPRVRNR